jgi:DNA repair exonuclease SbcCD ATPase subunit
MNLGKAKGTNFQSYPSIEFDYSGLGLALVSGITGSGKSTLLDLPAWTLFGITSKDSAADDVRAWGSDFELTSGSQEIDTPQGKITVYRIRGKSSSQNDFYWIEESAPDVKRRGKDVNDTLKLLEQRLGVTAELYFSGAYMHQFSTAEQFFIAKAKDRRESLEKISDLSLPIKIAERASEARKISKKQLEDLEHDQSRTEARLEQLIQSHKDNLADSSKWKASQAKRLQELNAISEAYESEKIKRVSEIVDRVQLLDKQIQDPKEFDKRKEQLKLQIKQFEIIKSDLKVVQKQYSEISADIRSRKTEYDRFNSDLGEFCPTCLGPAKNSNREAHVTKLINQIETLVNEQIEVEGQIKPLETALKSEPKVTKSFQDIVIKQSENQRLIDRIENERAKLKVIKAERNTYSDQIEKLKNESNPFEARRSQIEVLIEKSKGELKTITKSVSEMQHRISSLTTIYDKSFELRGRLIEQAVRELNDATNDLLERYFDASLRVQFTVTDGDKIDVLVLNNSYECPYKQLSGGERTLLKLCFNLPYMRRAENVAGIKFGCLMFDEPLKGLSDGLKEKAFTLFQSLEAEYDSIILIEHYEPFKSMVLNHFHIYNLGGHSQLEKIQGNEALAA